MGPQLSAVGDTKQPLHEALPADLVIRVLACLDDPRTRVYLQLVCKAWRAALKQSVRSVRIQDGPASRFFQLQWLITETEANPQQLQALEVHCLSDSEMSSDEEDTLACKDNLCNALQRFTGLKKLALMPGCCMDMCAKKTRLFAHLPDLEDLQLEYSLWDEARLGLPIRLAGFATVTNLRRLVLDLKSPVDSIELSHEWSRLTRLTELSLTSMQRLNKGTGVLEILMQRLQKLRLEARDSIWLPQQAPCLKIADLDFKAEIVLTARESMDYINKTPGPYDVYKFPFGPLHWPKLQQLTLGPDVNWGAHQFPLAQRDEEDCPERGNWQNLRSLSISYHVPQLQHFSGGGDFSFQGLTCLRIDHCGTSKEWWQHRKDTLQRTGTAPVYDLAEFSVLRSLQQLHLGILVHSRIQLSERLSALSALRSLTISSPPPRGSIILEGKLPVFARLASLVMDRVSLQSNSLCCFKEGASGKRLSEVPVDGPACRMLTSLEMTGIEPEVDARYFWSMPRLQQLKIVFGEPCSRHQRSNDLVYDLLQALLSLPALKALHVDALALGETVLPPLHLFELLEHVTIVCKCLGFGECRKQSPIGFGEARTNYSLGSGEGPSGLSHGDSLCEQDLANNYNMGSVYVCGDRWEGPPSVHLFLLGPKGRTPMWAGLSRYAPMVCRELREYHRDFAKNLVYEWKLGPPHPLDASPQRLTKCLDDYAIQLAAEYGISPEHGAGGFGIDFRFRHRFRL